MKLFKKKKPTEDMYGDYEDKFKDYVYTPEDLEQPSSIGGKINAMTYIDIAVIIAGVSLLFVIATIWVSIVTGGNVPIGIGILGFFAFLLSMCGVAITIYGHFEIRIEGKIPWLAGIISNGVIALFLMVLYIIGLF